MSAGQAASVGLLTLVAAFFLVPIVWLVLEAISGDIGLWLSNSAFYSTAGAAIAVVLCVPAGYGLATHEFPGRRALLIITIVVMLIPTNALVLPLFLEANSVHLLASPLAVILPYGLFPFGVYLSYLYFNTGSFHALLQSARIDGCGEWQAFRTIAAPLAAPVVALIVFLNFLASWTNFFLPWVMYWSLDETSRYPVALGIAVQLSGGEVSGPFAGYTGLLRLQTSSPPSDIAFLLLASVVPVLVVFGLAQRWIGSGQVQGMGFFR
ncbi:MAG TPA: ABC transporter permease subunit [Solirubrobacteraceae bacterium]|nr:ABC transporter permease subunit [Solirubrobacteraceae bacterium]